MIITFPIILGKWYYRLENQSLNDVLSVVNALILNTIIDKCLTGYIDSVFNFSAKLQSFLFVCVCSQDVTFDIEDNNISFYRFSTSTHLFSGCSFPRQWEGIWFQSTVRPYISIEGSEMSSKGHCHIDKGGRKFIVKRYKIPMHFFVGDTILLS